MGWNPVQAVADVAQSAYEGATGTFNPFSLGRFAQGMRGNHGFGGAFNFGNFANSFGPQNLIPKSIVPQKLPPAPKAPPGPNSGAAIGVANQQIAQDMQRRQGSQTLFTSGQGLLDTPLIASAILLGS